MPKKKSKTKIEDATPEAAEGIPCPSCKSPAVCSALGVCMQKASEAMSAGTRKPGTGQGGSAGGY